MSDYLSYTFFSHVMARINYFWWEGGDIYFLLDQHDQLDIYSANSLKQHSPIDSDTSYVFVPTP
jgi:hypothetical protein